MLQIAASWIEQEKKDIAAAKEAYMAENCPPPDLSGDQAALMVRSWNQLISFLWWSRVKGAKAWCLSQSTTITTTTKTEQHKSPEIKTNYKVCV